VVGPRAVGEAVKRTQFNRAMPTNVLLLESAQFPIPSHRRFNIRGDGVGFSPSGTLFPFRRT
jgi:hypothetical protein